MKCKHEAFVYYEMINESFMHERAQVMGQAQGRHGVSVFMWLG